MRRSRRFVRDNIGMNLFPFMAVLICTMGALIVLLVVMVQQARVRASAPEQADVVTRESEQRSAEQDRARYEQRRKLAEQNQIEIEDLQWKSQLLRTSFEKTTSQLRDQRLTLSHLEAHSRELSEEASKLQAEADLLAAAAETSQSDVNGDKQQLNNVNEQLVNAQSELETLNKQLSRRPTTYSLVPYDGPNGTNRRPMYIECLPDRVVLQPENIVLRGDDFGGAGGYETPLALALRAKREFWLAGGLLDQNREPYPLLVVRPGAASSYAAVRAAMKSWESEFGYELVENDIELGYEPADPRLVKLLEDVIDEARERRQVVAAMMARRERQVGSGRGGGGGELLRPSANGGFEVVRGSGHGPTIGRRGTSRAPVGQARRQGFGSGRSAAADAGYRSRFDRGANGGVAGRGTSDQPVGSGATRAPHARNGGDGDDFAGSHSTHGYGAGRTRSSDPRSQGASRGKEGAGDRANTAGGPNAGDAASDGKQRGTGGSSSKQGGAEGPGLGMSAGGGARGASSGQAFGVPQNLAQSRGKNWALPNVGSNDVGIRRPIRVSFRKDRLLIHPEKGTKEELQIFRHDGNVQAVVDPFVEAIRHRMDSWGIAGQGIFWRPILQAQVQSDSTSTYRQLLDLLEDSGIEVTRR